jgi:hypothetical protein
MYSTPGSSPTLQRSQRSETALSTARHCVCVHLRLETRRPDITEQVDLTSLTSLNERDMAKYAPETTNGTSSPSTYSHPRPSFRRDVCMEQRSEVSLACVDERLSTCIAGASTWPINRSLCDGCTPLLHLRNTLPAHSARIKKSSTCRACGVTRLEIAWASHSSSAVSLSSSTSDCTYPAPWAGCFYEKYLMCAEPALEKLLEHGYWDAWKERRQRGSM